MVLRKLRRIIAPGSTKEEELFTRIYEEQYWKGKKSRSGIGSDLEQTRVIRREIPELLRDMGVSVLLDAPCGDFFWMKEVDLPVERYVGVDIVKELIAINNRKYANERRHFLCLNIIRDRLPAADIILCRDCFVHLNYDQIITAIRNFKRSGTTYLLVTTFPDRHTNQDIPDSFYFRPLNMQLAPFNFPEPILLINEQCTEEELRFQDKSLGLWKLSGLVT